MVLRFDLLGGMEFGPSWAATNPPFKLVAKLFEYLRSVQLLPSLPSSNHEFPKEFLWLLIKLEYQLYCSLKQSSRDQQTYQELLLSSLTFFHTLSLPTMLHSPSTLQEQREKFFEEESQVLPLQ